MLRKMAMVVMAMLVLGTAWAAPLRQHVTRVDEPFKGVTWVSRAPLDVKVAAAGPSCTMAGPRPVVLLETNYYTFLPGEKWHLRMSLDANGWTDAATLYLYMQNRVTGEKQYYNLPAGGLLPVGDSADLFGSAGSPVTVNIPTLNDFVLFGTASDPAEVGWGVNGALGGAVTVPTGQTGRYQYVLEVRDAMGKAVISRGNAMYSFVDQRVVITSDLTSNATWTADKAYVLAKATFVRQPNTLTIEPGTVVIGTAAGGSLTAMIVDRGAKIVADGTAMQPIVFTSDQRVGDRARADWGGLIINGRAPINLPGGEAPGEGDTGLYGGGATPDPHHSSGVLRYVRVEFAGARITPENELNGIAFQGVGDGTIIDYVQVHYNKDDMVEFFGGTANAKHLLLIGTGDDNLDWVEGWTGNVQWVVALMREDDGDNGIEADNKSGNNNLLPRSSPQVFNATFIGPAGGGTSAYGGLFREGTAGQVFNSVFYSFKKSGVSIRNESTWQQVDGGTFKLDSNLYHGNGNYDATKEDGPRIETFLFTTQKHNQKADPMLTSPRTLAMPDVTPLPGSSALDMTFVKTPPDNGFFDTNVTCLGGVCPGDNWVLGGWAVFSNN